MSLESKIMRSFNICCNSIKDKVFSDIVEAASQGAVSLSREDLAKIKKIVDRSVDYTAMNSSKQMQSVINENS
jgi:hypothetical protein